MDYKTRTTLQKFAEAIKKEYYIPTIVINIKQVVTAMGGTLAYGKSVILCKTGDNSFDITIPTDTIPSMEPFLVASQLYYLFHNLGFATSDEKWNEVKTNVPIKMPEEIPGIDNALREQTYAKAFACAFLMPEKEYRKVIKENTKNNTVNTKIVSEYFHVPITMVVWWGNVLQILKPDWPL